jgi:hypothetical protein
MKAAQVMVGILFLIGVNFCGTAFMARRIEHSFGSIEFYL